MELTFSWKQFWKCIFWGSNFKNAFVFVFCFILRKIDKKVGRNINDNFNDFSFSDESDDSDEE